MGEDQIQELEANTLELYLKELEAMVSMPELYKSNYSLWWRMVKDTLRYPSIYPTDEKIDWALIYKYEEIRSTPQHLLDLFVSKKGDDWSASFLQGPTPERESHGNMDTEGYMKAYEVDRPTALKIKSLHRKRVYLEPEWVKIQDI